MRKIGVGIVLVFCMSAAFADPLTFTFPVIRSYPEMELSDVIVNDSIYVDGIRDRFLYKILLSTGQSERINGIENVFRVYAYYGEKVLFGQFIEYEYKKGRFASYHEPKEYNPQTGNVKNSYIMWWIMPRERGAIFPHQYYQNDIFYSQDVKYREEEGGTAKSKISIYDYANKKVTPFPLQAALWDMSADKMHLLLAEDTQDSITIYNIQSGKAERGYGYWEVGNEEGFITKGAGFLSNDMFLIPRDFYNSQGAYELRSVNNKSFKLSYVFLIQGVPQGVYDFTFSKDLTRALVKTTLGKTLLCDTTAFRDDLISKNLLFRPTTAVSTESRVRICRRAD